MEKIRLGKNNMMVTRVGFGGIPIQRVSEDESIAVVRRCLDLGINYFDTATGYTTSQERIGKAIAGRPEERIIATKSFPKDANEFKKNLSQSLEKLGVAAVDLYQFHAVSNLEALDAILAPSDVMVAMQEAKKAGRVKHIGFSTHQIDVAKAGIRSGQFETVMYPFNFIACEAADELLPLAREHDVGFIAIKAFSGGRLQNANIALKYLFQFPEILVVVGMEKPHEVEEIVKILEKPQITPSEQEEMQRLREELSPRFCRHCDRCLPCPEGVPIPLVMDFEGIFKSIPPASIYEGPLGDMMRQATKCNDCGECEKKCPYHISIMALIHEYMGLYEEGRKRYEAGLKR